MGSDGQVVPVEGQQHRPIRLGILKPIQFHRRGCGFTVAEYGDRPWWISAASAIRSIATLEELVRALTSTCWYYRKSRQQVVAAAEAAQGQR
jgi:hypothetical protein